MLTGMGIGHDVCQCGGESEYRLKMAGGKMITNAKGRRLALWNRPSCLETTKGAHRALCSRCARAKSRLF